VHHFVFVSSNIQSKLFHIDIFFMELGYISTYEDKLLLQEMKSNRNKSFDRKYIHDMAIQTSFQSSQHHFVPIFSSQIIIRASMNFTMPLLPNRGGRRMMLKQ
jgi:hypothetical protein